MITRYPQYRDANPEGLLCVVCVHLSDDMQRSFVLSMYLSSSSTCGKSPL
jgi:hypothetical protein